MTKDVFLFVGIGNVGDKFEFTRHNVGFLFVDKLADAFGVASNKGVRFDSEYYCFDAGVSKVYAIKPHTFVNLTGESVQKWKKFYKIPNDNIFVFYDDASTPLGKIKIKNSGSSGGHNGIKSITSHIGSGYFQIKFGLQPFIPSTNSGAGAIGGKQEDSGRKITNLAGFVLGRMSPPEASVIEKQISAIIAKLSLLIGKTETGKSAIIDAASFRLP